jgi:hypothetical protein
VKNSLVAILALMFVAVFVCPVMAEMRPVKIEQAGVLPGRVVAMDIGLALEKGREIEPGFKYDNVRLQPLGVRFGLGNGLEVGGYLGLSVNSRDDFGAPDESGLEGLTVFGKLAVNPNIAVQLGLTIGGDDDIAPYPNDGLDLFINVPMQAQLGIGLLYGQFGYKVQGGDFDSNSYFNYGIGYALPLNDRIGFNVELVGEEAHITKVGFVGNTLDLVLGANMALADNIRLDPYLSVGLYDSSPDVAVGAALEIRF